MKWIWFCLKKYPFIIVKKLIKSVAFWTVDNATKDVYLLLTEY